MLMNKLFALLSFLWLGNEAGAQSTAFKPFKFDLAAGYAVPAGKGAKTGLIFAMEPKYAVNDQVSVGLRMEAAVMARAYVDRDGMLKSADVKASGSYLATADYYFNTERFRPFAGAGLGLYRLAGSSLNTDEEELEINSVSRFGFMPRAGFEFGHFRTALEYNFVGKTGRINNNYFGIKMGFFIGGGRIRE